MKIILAVIAFIIWVNMLKKENASKIRNSKYWPIAFIGHIFLACLWVSIFGNYIFKVIQWIPKRDKNWVVSFYIWTSGKWFLNNVSFKIKWGSFNSLISHFIFCLNFWLHLLNVLYCLSKSRGGLICIYVVYVKENLKA